MSKRVAVLLWIVSALGVFSAEGDAGDWELTVSKLRSTSAAEVRDASRRLIEGGAETVPALGHGLKDPTVQRACVAVLAQMDRELVLPVLLGSLRACPELRFRDQVFKCDLVGALGLLGDKRAVPLLEKLYSGRAKRDDMIGMSLAWSLEKITGKTYGPTHDPRRLGKL